MTICVSVSSDNRMETVTTDHARMLESMIRAGHIAEVDHASARVRLKTGGLLTDWLPWFTPRAGTTREWDPPTIGEAGVAFCPSGNPACGFVLVGLFSEKHPAPSQLPDEHLRVYPDGARVLYDHATGAMSITGIKTLHIEVSTLVTVDCPDTHLTGNLTVDKRLTYKGGMDNAGTGTGAIITGPITHTGGNLSSNGVVVHTHRHPGDSGGTTGGPL